MAGQHELDLRCTTPCGDIVGVKTAVEMLVKRQDEHFEVLKKIMEKQDDNYETIRKRIHEVVNDTNKAIGSTALNAERDIDEVGTRVNVLNQNLSKLSTDLSLVSHTVTENAVKSEERHQALVGSISDLTKSLVDHMKDEPETLKKALEPISDSLTKLHSRWWSIMIWLLGTLGAGAGYLFLDKLGWI